MKNENVKEKVNAEGVELNDEQLAKVSGGADDECKCVIIGGTKKKPRRIDR